MQCHHPHMQMRRLGPREVKSLAKFAQQTSGRPRILAVEFSCTCNTLSIICYLCRHNVTSKGPFPIYF